MFSIEPWKLHSSTRSTDNDSTELNDCQLWLFLSYDDSFSYSNNDGLCRNVNDPKLSWSLLEPFLFIDHFPSNSFSFIFECLHWDKQTNEACEFGMQYTGRLKLSAQKKIPFREKKKHRKAKIKCIFIYLFNFIAICAHARASIPNPVWHCVCQMETLCFTKVILSAKNALFHNTHTHTHSWLFVLLWYLWKTTCSNKKMTKL